MAYYLPINRKRAVSKMIALFMVFCLTFTTISIMMPREVYAATGISVTLTGAGAGDTAMLYGKNADGDWDSLTGDVAVNAGGGVGFPGSATVKGTYSYTVFTVRFTNGSDGIIPDQFIGGWFDVEYRPSSIPVTTFTVTSSAGYTGTFALIQPAVLTLKVTPKMTGTVIFPYTETYVNAYLLTKDPKSGAPDYINVDFPEYNDTTGTYKFYVTPGLTYIFSAYGYTYNNINQYDNNMPEISYHTSYLGGYMGILKGDPPNITKVIAPPAGQTKAAGTIDLGHKGTAMITGKLPAGSNMDVRVCNPVTGDWYFSTWDNATKTYGVKNLSTGLYAVMYGDSLKFIEVKSGKAYTVDFDSSGKWVDIGDVSTSISGKPVGGKTIMASSTVMKPGYQVSAPEFSYIWTDGVRILSRSASYKVPNSLAGKDLYLITLATAHGYTQWSIQYAYGKVVGSAGFSHKVTGKYKVGKKLKVKITKRAVKGQKHKYQWLRNGKAIKGKAAKKATYKLCKADKGKKISVKVTSSAKDWISVTKISKAKKVK